MSGAAHVVLLSTCRGLLLRCSLSLQHKTPTGTTPLPAGQNPATWMLEVTGGSMAIATACNSVDWPALYAASSLAAENAAQADVLVAQGLRCGMPLHMSSMYAQPPSIQVRKGVG